MKGEFISYEHSLALKELGFDEPCFATYFSISAWQIDCTEGGLNLKNNTPSDYSILAPIYQQAYSFLLSKLSDNFALTFFSDNSGAIIEYLYSSLVDNTEYNFNSREEAVKILIELCKNN